MTPIKITLIIHQRRCRCGSIHEMPETVPMAQFKPPKKNHQTISSRYHGSIPPGVHTETTVLESLSLFCTKCFPIQEKLTIRELTRPKPKAEAAQESVNTTPLSTAIDNILEDILTQIEFDQRDSE